MNLLPSIDLNSIAPALGLAAIAVVIILALLLRTVLHSRLALLIAIVAGVVVAGPALGSVLTNVINTLALVFIVFAGAAVGALLIIRSHPDLLAMVREALSLLPRQSPPPPLAPPLALPPAANNQRSDSITIVDQPPARQIAHRNSGSDWGF